MQYESTRVMYRAAPAAYTLASSVDQYDVGATGDGRQSEVWLDGHGDDPLFYHGRVNWACIGDRGVVAIIDRSAATICGEQSTGCAGYALSALWFTPICGSHSIRSMAGTQKVHGT
ncbi:hypothetical protein D3C73_1379260 [compost metagenome]